MQTVRRAIVIAGLLAGLLGGCSEGTIDDPLPCCNELGMQPSDADDGASGSSSSGTDPGGDSEAGSDDGDGGSTYTGGGANEGDGGSGGTVPELPDLDCEPQPPWYYPKPALTTSAL